VGGHESNQKALKQGGFGVFTLAAQQKAPSEKPVFQHDTVRSCPIWKAPYTAFWAGALPCGAKQSSPNLFRQALLANPFFRILKAPS
jgi:hypothetical protein